MVLLIAQTGPAAGAIGQALKEQAQSVLSVSPAQEDLFGTALGNEAIIYVPGPSLLSQWLEPRSDPTTLERVLGASLAPGVHLLVLVVADSPKNAPLEQTVRRCGKPFLIVRSAPLLEEIAEELLQEPSHPLWLPRQGSVPIASAQALAAAVLGALQTERQGRVLGVDAQRLDVVSLFAQALSCRAQGVHALWPPLFRVMRPIVRAVRGFEPKALSLCDQLLQSAAPCGASP